MTPLASMVETGAADGRIDMAIWPDEVALACRPDTVVWQRQVEDGQIEAMQRWREALPDALFVYELDDYLGEIPPASFHASFMPPDIADRVKRGLSVCDRATTTTEPLAAWLHSLGMKDVRIVPNGLPQGRVVEREQRAQGPLRIGFAGGMSHDGDLAILRHAMETIGDDAVWVFMGMQPEGELPCRVEFHEGVAVHGYLEGIRKLDLDLILAPLEENRFNLCKSNLRLVEAGCLGTPVIAQDLPPYHVDRPPVFAYADTPESWTAAIRGFLYASQAARQRSADAMRNWTANRYTLEKLLPKRLDAWTKGPRWRPSPAGQRVDSCPVVACAEGEELVQRMRFLAHARIVQDGLEKACETARSLGTDVLWLRPATSMDEASWKAVAAAAAQADDIASAVPLASDGPNSFPLLDRWLPVPPTAMADMSAVAREEFEGRRLIVSMLGGPAVLLTRHALSMLGTPDVAGCDGNEEQAILDWAVRASARQWKHVQAPEGFAASLAPPAPPTQRAALRIQARGFAGWLQQKSETLTTDERESLELALLRRQWGGPRPGSMGFGTGYEDWAKLRDARFRTPKGPGGETFAVVDFDESTHLEIAAFGDSLEDLRLDEWVILHDDTVEVSQAVFHHLADALPATGEHSEVVAVYADHESVVGERTLPEFKPDFDLELFLAQDYVTPVCAVRMDFLREQGIPLDRTELYALLLNAALKYGAKAFRHVPHVLGRMRDQKPEEIAAELVGRQVAVELALGNTAKVEPSKSVFGCLKVVRRTAETPLVSIVVPTLGSGRLIQPCVATILQHTRYPNYEVLVVQNGPREAPELSGTAASDPRVRVVRWDGESFNWSKLNNDVVRAHARGEFILTLNDDVCVGTKDWLDAMVAMAVQPDVGAVGARLLHPMGMVQHCGVVCHRGTAGHLHAGLPNGQAGHLGRAVLTHEASAVTGACMLFRRRHFDAVDGFDETLSHNYNDVAFCMALRTLGLRNVVEMSAELLHNGGTSRAGEAMDFRRFVEEGRRVAQICAGPDPYWNPNLTVGFASGMHTAPQGLNAEMLAWEDFRPREGAKRVLLVNDLPGAEGRALDVLAAGDVPFAADLSGFRLRLTAPNALNARTWDVRDPGALATGLARLGIDRIVLRSLVGAEGAAPPVETLRALDPRFVQVPVELDPAHPGALAAWLAPDGGEAAGRIFGRVDMDAWRDAYERLAPLKEAA